MMIMTIFEHGEGEQNGAIRKERGSGFFVTGECTRTGDLRILVVGLYYSYISYYTLDILYKTTYLISKCGQVPRWGAIHGPNPNNPKYGDFTRVNYCFELLFKNMSNFVIPEK